jgi:hypothetical protein
MMIQVPVVLDKRVVPLTEQFALPAAVTAKVTAPLPDPHVVKRKIKALGELTVCAGVTRAV